MIRGMLIGLVLVTLLVGWRAGGSSQPEPSQQLVSKDAPNKDWQARSSGGSIEIRRGWNGHFFVNADVAGEPIRFVVDTGATTVAVSRNDARRLGLSLTDADFTHEMSTASGTIRGAPVTLPRLRIGDIQLLDVRAVVIDIPETMPLLGQTFLSRLDRVSIEGDRMTLSKS